MTKYILALIGAVIIGGAIWGGYLYPIVSSPKAGSPVGATFNDGKVAQVNISPATLTSTSTSILNTDGSARWVADFGFTGCTTVGNSFTSVTGTGLAQWLVQAATTSVPNQGLQGNTNYALNMTVATSSTSAAYLQSASSTVPAQQGYWAPNTYMTFTFNATNTAACTVELDYIAS